MYRRVAAALVTTSVVSLAFPGLLNFCRLSSRSHMASAMASTSNSCSSNNQVSFINSTLAKAIDVQLMDPQNGGFSIDQLMELAGLSVATAAHDMLQTELLGDKQGARQSASVLVLCGPGNNGGDGLVAARHLLHFGHRPTILYPKKSAGALFDGLVRQCQNLDIPIIMGEEADVAKLSLGAGSSGSGSEQEFDLIIDGLFGFSFSGTPREPFLSLLRALGDVLVPILSIDIPSGWAVDVPPYASSLPLTLTPTGESVSITASGTMTTSSPATPPVPAYPIFFTPRAVISLTAPKLCMMGYGGTHYVGGRFVPPAMGKQLGLTLVRYSGTDQVVKLPRDAPASGAALAEARGENDGKIVVSLVTAPTLETAEKIAEALVSSRQAACVNIMPHVTSIYTWEGKLDRGSEVLMLIKSRADEASVARLIGSIQRLHTYDTPEIIQTPITGGLGKYIQWVLDSTTPPSAEGVEERASK